MSHGYIASLHTASLGKKMLFVIESVLVMGSVISGMVNRGAPFNIWSGFQAAHIFPVESESYWTEQDYGRWIRDVTPGVSKINSRQNGFLLQATVHIDFDNYLVSVNPDVSVPIVLKLTIFANL